MKSRRLIEKACGERGLRIMELRYDRHIGYDSGGWELVVEDPYEPGCLIEYVGHHAAHIVSDLERRWRTLIEMKEDADAT